VAKTLEYTCEDSGAGGNHAKGESIAQRLRRSQRGMGDLERKLFGEQWGCRGSLIAGNRCLGFLFQFSGLVHSRVLLLAGFKFCPLRTFIGRLPGRANVNEPIERIKPERGSHRSG
jgi:hypothetical protein